MLHNIKGTSTLECENCGETYENEDKEEFRMFVASAKEANWKFRKVGDVWFHYCPSCSDT